MSRNHLGLNSRFKLGFLVNSSFMLLELVIGLMTGSLILLADAAHNLTDSVTLAISWLGNKVAERPADDNHSLGHGRVSVMAAFVNSVILVVVAILIFFEAYQRFMHPTPLQGGVIAIVAFVGILANGFVAYLFHQDKGDLNVRAAYTNMAFDAIFSIAALFAGVLIVLTNKTWIDPLISVGVGIGLLYAAFGILKQATHIFLEGVPKELDVTEIRSAILQDNAVNDVKDIFIWAISSNEYVLCCSIIPNDKEYKKIQKATDDLRKNLANKGFSRVIIEVT